MKILKIFVIQNEIELGFPNMINLVGIESPGLTCSLAIGKYVNNMIKLDIKPCTINRRIQVVNSSVQS